MVIKVNRLIKKNRNHERKTAKHIPDPTEYLEGALLEMNNFVNE